MNKSFLGLAVGAALTLSVSTALADGYGYGSVKDGPMVAPQVNWSGLYIGAAVGYGIATTDLSGYSYTKEIIEKLKGHPVHWHENYAETGAKGVSGDGVQGTLTLGYDQQIHPGLLIGIFGDYTFGDLESEHSVNGMSSEAIWVLLGTAYDRWLEPAHLKTKIGDSWSIGARIGLVQEKTLWYAFAGYTEADFDWDFAAYFDGEHFAGGSGSKTLNGYFLGLGVEHQLFQNVSLKLEYRYTDYDKVTFGSYYEEEDYGHASKFRADPDVHSIRLGVNWKVDLFGNRHAAYDTLK